MDDRFDPFRPLDEGEAAGVPPPQSSNEEMWSPEVPAPEEPPVAAVIHHRRLGTPVAAWTYRDVLGRPLFQVVRFDLVNRDGSSELDSEGKQKKEVLPRTYGTRGKTRGWHFKAPPTP